MRLQNSKKHAKSLRHCLATASLFLLVGIGNLHANSSQTELHLEVFINGNPTNLIASFFLLEDQSILASRSELAELAIRPPENGNDNELVELNGISGLTYSYDPAKQIIEISTPETNLIARNYSSTEVDADEYSTSSSTGLVLNYDLLGAFDTDIDAMSSELNGISASLDGRVYSPFGIAETSGIVRTDKLYDSNILRLNSTFTYSDVATSRTLKIGDFISSGFAWTRPIRIGGFQIQKDFSLRPDLITNPLPTVSGSAAVPSTVDVFVGNLKTVSRDVAAGPFNIENVPVTSRTGDARIVVLDSSGRETETNIPFNAPANLLRKGLFDYSLEAGVARKNFGSKSNDYDERPILSSSLRYGLRDTLTIQGHGEFSQELSNIGLGAVFSAGNHSVVSVAVSGSSFNGQTGGQIYASLETEFGDWTVKASTLRQLSDYYDLAALSQLEFQDTSGAETPYQNNQAIALDKVSVSVPTIFDRGNLTFNYIHAEYQDNRKSHIFGASYQHRLTNNVSVYANASFDAADQKNAAIYAGLSVVLGEREHMGFEMNATGTDASFNARYSKSGDGTAGSMDWQARARIGESSLQQAQVTYHGVNSEMRIAAAQNDGRISTQAQMDGALVLANGDLFATKRIDDAFAVVDVGVTDVDILYENRPIGKTNRNGKLLVSNLRSYQKNKLTINTTDLPVDVSIPRSDATVRPADKSGVVVDLKVQPASSSALVVLLTEDGKKVAVGSEGQLRDSSETFIVGYDGQAFIENLQAENSITIETGGGQCSANFAFNPEPGTQVLIEGVVCR